MAEALVLGGGGVAKKDRGRPACCSAWPTPASTSPTPTSWSAASAGSVVAAQVATGVPLGELHERQVAGPRRAELAIEFDVEAMANRFVEMLRDRPGTSTKAPPAGEAPGPRGRHRSRGPSASR